MGLDSDFRRDAATAFAPSALVEGAILPYQGRAFVRRAEGVWEQALKTEADGWLSPDNPVIVRGAARILPLAWAGDATGVTAEEIAEFSTQLEGTGYYWARSARTLDELGASHADSNASYAKALAAAGATRATCWTISQAVAVALVEAGDTKTGTASLALHVVPASWVSEVFVAKPVRGIDVRWSWTDVIDLYRARVGAASDSAGSLAEHDEEGRTP